LWVGQSTNLKSQLNTYSQKYNISYNLKSSNSSVHKHVHHNQTKKLHAHELKWFRSIHTKTLICYINQEPGYHKAQPWFPKWKSAWDDLRACFRKTKLTNNTWTLQTSPLMFLQWERWWESQARKCIPRGEGITKYLSNLAGNAAIFQLLSFRSVECIFNSMPLIFLLFPQQTYIYRKNCWLTSPKRTQSELSSVQYVLQSQTSSKRKCL